MVVHLEQKVAGVLHAPRHVGNADLRGRGDIFAGSMDLHLQGYLMAGAVDPERAVNGKLTVALRR